MSIRGWVGLFCIFSAAICYQNSAFSQWNPPNPVVSFEKQPNGVEIRQKAGVLRLEVNASDVLHVTYSPLGAGTPIQPADRVVMKKDWAATSFDVTSDDKAVTLATQKLKVVVERESGAMHYAEISGKQLTTDSYRSLKPVEVNGEKTLHAESFFAIYGSHEGFYGLGQHQGGVWNYRGEIIPLRQENTEIVVPLLVSTNGYGIFWNNASRSLADNKFVHSLYLTAEVADRIDYYFLYGPDADQIIGHYRDLTG